MVRHIWQRSPRRGRRPSSPEAPRSESSSVGCLGRLPLHHHSTCLPRPVRPFRRSIVWISISSARSVGLQRCSGWIFRRTYFGEVGTEIGAEEFGDVAEEGVGVLSYFFVLGSTTLQGQIHCADEVALELLSADGGGDQTDTLGGCTPTFSDIRFCGFVQISSKNRHSQSPQNVIFHRTARKYTSSSWNFHRKLTSVEYIPAHYGSYKISEPAAARGRVR